MTGCCSATVLLPSEVVKAKTQVVVGNMESSSSDVYRKMIQRQGIRVRISCVWIQIIETSLVGHISSIT